MALSYIPKDDPVYLLTTYENNEIYKMGYGEKYMLMDGFSIKVYMELLFTIQTLHGVLTDRFIEEQDQVTCHAVSNSIIRMKKYLQYLSIMENPSWMLEKLSHFVEEYKMFQTVFKIK